MKAAAPGSAFAAELRGLRPSELAGQLLVIGFAGTDLPPSVSKALAAAERAGVILFRRNLLPGREGLGAAQRFCAAIARAARPEWPPLIAIDEEGGRVARLGAPALRMPPMRRIAEAGGPPLIERVARAVGAELRCLGLTMNFAPVVDVDTNPENPIIGDRAFARDPERVAECGAAYSRGLASAGVQSCLKHFPGHGDTLLDSHLALPTVAHDTDRLRSVELVPFARLAREADSIMTAHVLYPALDALPATLSRRISTELLRGELGFAGVLFSDDLEMRAMAGYGTMAEVAVGAIEAGCDVLLICSDEARQAEVHEALTRRIERDAAFRERCLEAASRSATLRRARPPQPGTEAELDLLLDSHLRPLEAELAALVAEPQV